MEWASLLKSYRLGCPKDEVGQDSSITDFQRDFDRIIFSTAFRRLNGKTQVFPFPESDVVHTRLTHSLEASSVGRSLGTIVGNELKEKYSEFIDGWQVGAIVSAACLAHDIGNPPFGHSGEKAISEYFQSERGLEIIKNLPTKQKEDLINFEGNSMGFHILTYSNPQITKVSGGLGLTYPVLASFTKYPRPSLTKNVNKIVCEKKPGLLHCDLDVYREITKELQIPLKQDNDKWYRHPLAYLTEAADDICYGIMDLEDGYKHRLIGYDKTADLMTTICNADTGNTDAAKLNEIIDERNRIGYLRAKAINSLIHQSAKIFIENEDILLRGKLEKPISDIIESAPTLKEISDLSVSQIYSHRPVLQVEAAGFRVLPGLLDSFLCAIKDPNKHSSKKILQQIPKEYIFDFEEKSYEAIISITSYVAGMTDSFAVDMYRNLRGIQLPNS